MRWKLKDSLHCTLTDERYIILSEELGDSLFLFSVLLNIFFYILYKPRKKHVLKLLSFILALKRLQG